MCWTHRIMLLPSGDMAGTSMQLRCNRLTLSQDEVLPTALLQARVSEQQEASDICKPVLLG